MQKEPEHTEPSRNVAMNVAVYKGAGIWLR